MMPMRGVRGATVVDEDTPESITFATRELLQAMLEANPDMELGDLASAIFTVTQDLSSIFPAQAARNAGWSKVPLICAREIPVPGDLPRCIRVLLHWNTNRTQEEIQHVYLGQASKLRPEFLREIPE